MGETATVERWHSCYQRGLITLSELIEELAEVDREYGAKPITRDEMLANRAAESDRSCGEHGDALIWEVGGPRMPRSSPTA